MCVHGLEPHRSCGNVGSRCVLACCVLKGIVLKKFQNGMPAASEYL